MSSNFNQNPFINEDNEEVKVLKRLRLIYYLLISLAFLRIFSLQFIWMINDLLGATIVYCTYLSKDKFMALFCIITSVMSVIYELTIAPADIARYKSAQPYNQKIFNNLNNTNNVTNFMPINENLDQNIYDNNLNTNNFDLVYTMMIITLIYALLIYSGLVYYSIKAFSMFRNPFDSIDREMTYPGRNYGTVEETRSSTGQPNQSNFVAFSGRGVTLGTGS
jgi:hypothetical protein